MQGAVAVTECVGFFHVSGHAGIGLRSGTEQVWYSISSGFLCFVAPGLYLASKSWMLERICAVQKPAGVYRTNLLG